MNIRAKISMITVATLVGGAAIAAPAPRAAPTIGTIQSGQALISRDGKLIQAGKGTTLRAGDKVATRGRAGTTLQMASGCVMTVPQTSIVSVDGGCDAKATGFSPASGTMNSAGANALVGEGLGFGQMMIAVGATAALAGGVYAAADSGPAKYDPADETGTPVSP